MTFSLTTLFGSPSSRAAAVNEPLRTTAGVPHCAGAGRLLTTASTLSDDGTVTHDLACILTGQATSTVPVATIYANWDPTTGTRTCLTASDPGAANAGYWDLGGYATCDGQGLPGCLGGSRPVVTASTTTPAGQIKQQVACVLGGQSTETPVVATLESENDTVADANRCWTAADPEGRAAGLFDLHDYAFCTEAGLPMCEDDEELTVSHPAAGGVQPCFRTNKCMAFSPNFRSATV